MNAQAPTFTVLVIDDDPGIRRVLARYLAVEGLTAHEAEHGRAGLAYLRGGGAADAIVLDLRMPVMDGWAFRREQLNDPLIAQIPVVVLSGADADRFDELAAAAAFAKPAKMAELVACVRTLCEKARTGS